MNGSPPADLAKPSSTNSMPANSRAPCTNTSTVLVEGWLVRSRVHGFRFPIIKSKWVRRYFVLQHFPHLGVVLDEYRNDSKRRLCKRLDMHCCVEVDSYLQLTDSSCTSMLSGIVLQWIFSLHYDKHSSGKKVEVFFVADNEQDMLHWVSAICKACRLEKQSTSLDQFDPLEERDIPMPLPKAPISRGMRSDASLLSASLAGDSVTSSSTEFSNRNRYDVRCNRYASGRTSRPLREYRNIREKKREVWPEEDSASVCSSASSIPRSLTGVEDDTSSCISSAASTSKPQTRKPRTRSLPPLVLNVSSSRTSGATLQTSLESPAIPSSPFTTREHSVERPFKKKHPSPPPPLGRINFEDAQLLTPPAVDRSRKPRSSNIQSDDDRRSVDSAQRPILPARSRRESSISRRNFEAPKSAGYQQNKSSLDYFEPIGQHQIRANSLSNSATLPRGQSNNDTGYIFIDAEKTKAIEQLRAQRTATAD